MNKPRLVFKGRKWVCRDRLMSRAGETPLEAYNNWWKDYMAVYYEWRRNK